jgi:hypothetical protein
MKEFTRKHFFGPDGQVIAVPSKTHMHIDHVYNNPQLFGFRDRKHVNLTHQIGGGAWNPLMKRGFIRGEYGFDGTTHIHNLTYEGDKGATPIKFLKALETLHQHYSNHPKRKFTIGLFASSNQDEDDILNNKVNKIVGDESIDDGLHTLNHIKEFIDSVKVKPKAEPAKRSKKSVESGPPIIDTSRLGKEPPMAQGSMTTAEWNFYRRMGLGDSYNPIKSFKEFLFENYE